MEMDRRTLLHGAAAVGGLLLASRVPAQAGVRRAPGWIEGKMTGAMAVVETLLPLGSLEGTEAAGVVFEELLEALAAFVVQQDNF